MRNASTLAPLSPFHEWLQNETIAALRERRDTISIGTKSIPVDNVNDVLADFTSLSVNGVGLFAIANTLNHSCEPNTCLASTANNNTLSLLCGTRTAKPAADGTLIGVERGAELTISYVDETLPKEKRAEQLRGRYKIEKCDCPRCSK